MDSEGFWNVEETEPGSGHLRRVAGDATAYALRILGDALEPRYRSGDFLIIRPSIRCEPDRPVYIVFDDGRATVRELARVGEGLVVLRSLRDGSRMTVEQAKIAIMHRVTGQADAIEFEETPP